MKHCRFCDRTLDEAEFHKHPTASGGLSHKCRECTREAYRAYYAKPEVKARAIERARDWRNDNPERRREIAAAWDERNRDARREWNREYRRAVRLADPAAERLRNIAAAHTRRLREKAAGKLSVREARIVLSVARGVCTYCGARGRPLTLDHFRPIAGPSASHTWSNLIACCKSCNSSKSTSDGADWLLKRFGAPGLARTIIAMKANRKAVRRLLPAAYWHQVELEQDRMIAALEATT